MSNTFNYKDVGEILEDFKGINYKEILPSDGKMGTGGWVAIAAAERGHVSTLRYLHERGVDLDKEVIGHGIAGWRPLDVGAASGHENVVDFFHKIGADFSFAVKGSDGRKPLVDVVRLNGHSDLADKIERLAKDSITTVSREEVTGRVDRKEHSHLTK